MFKHYSRMFSLSFLLISMNACSQNEVDKLSDLNKSTEVGMIGEYKVIIPGKYLKSTSIVSTNNGQLESVQSDKKIGRSNSNISEIMIELRAINYEPILNQSDFNDWFANHMKPSKAIDIGHRWLFVAIENNEATSQKFLMYSQLQKRKNVSCSNSKKFGLMHCTINNAKFSEPNEYFIEQKSQKTLIACTTMKDLRQCMHYFLLDTSGVIVTTYFESDEGIQNWEEIEQRIRPIVTSFLSK